jgi:hypothetical protein
MPRCLKSVLLVAVSLAFALPARAQTTTALFLDSQPGDYIGTGVQQTYHDDDGTAFTAGRHSPTGGISISLRETGCR